MKAAIPSGPHNANELYSCSGLLIVYLLRKYVLLVVSAIANPSDPGSSLTQTSVSGSSCSHPADPENKDLVDRALLAEVLQLGFEEAIAILAISKTRGSAVFNSLQKM